MRYLLELMHPYLHTHARSLTHAGAYEYLCLRHCEKTGDTPGDVSRLFVYYVGRLVDAAEVCACGERERGACILPLPHSF